MRCDSSSELEPAAMLILDGRVLTSLDSLGQSVDAQCERMRLLPHEQFLEIRHAG